MPAHRALSDQYRPPLPARPRRRLLRNALLSVGGLLLAPARAFAATGDRRLSLIVPGPAGSAGDTMLRLIAEQLQDELGQPVALLHQPGAGGVIATGNVARAAPDGHTIGYAHLGTLAVNPAMHGRLPYDPDRDLESIALIGHVAIAAVVRPDLPADTLADLALAARRAPEGLSFGSTGHGSTSHLAAEWFGELAGAALTHVPYGDVGLYRDLAEGRIDLAFLPVPAALPLVRGQRVRALAVTQPRRSPLLPELPAAGESGMAAMDVRGWGGLVTAARTPPGIVDSLNAAVNRALARPALRLQLERMGVEPHTGSPGDLTDLARAERSRWGPVLARLGLRADARRGTAGAP